MVEARHRLAENLRDAVKAVWQKGRVGSKLFALRVITDRVIAGGEKNARQAVQPCRLVEIVDPAQIGRLNRVEGPLDGNSAEMNDAVAAPHEIMDRLLVLKRATNGSS